MQFMLEQDWNNIPGWHLFAIYSLLQQFSTLHTILCNAIQAVPFPDKSEDSMCKLMHFVDDLHFFSHFLKP